MSTSEYAIVDTKGSFTLVVKDGRKLDDVGWTNGRVILSNKRLVLVGTGGKRTIPLDRVRGITGRHDVNQRIANVGDYVGLRVDDDVVLITTGEDDDFGTDIYRALLDHEIFMVRHPAVAGGVVQDTTWEKARIKIGDGELNVALASGTLVVLDLADVGSFGVNERTVDDESKPVLEVEHTEDGTSVQTYLTGTVRQCALLESYFGTGGNRRDVELELDERETEILMVLYSGVSPFDVPDFLGTEVDEVEEIYERLIELDVLEEVRVRREVALKARGRNLASEAMTNQ